MACYWLQAGCGGILQSKLRGNIKTIKIKGTVSRKITQGSKVVSIDRSSSFKLQPVAWFQRFFIPAPSWFFNNKLLCVICIMQEWYIYFFASMGFRSGGICIADSKYFFTKLLWRYMDTSPEFVLTQKMSSAHGALKMKKHIWHIFLRQAYLTHIFAS